ncbi:MAG: endonuclease/exonuclease/phosphatase family protein [Burkholderiales bacterium]
MSSRTAWADALRRWLTAGRVGVAGIAVVLGACVSITADPRAILAGPDGVEVRTLPCEAALGAARRWFPAAPAGAAIDPARLRILTWNIHKQDDAGWDADLARFAASHDIVLLQEVTLADDLTGILRREGLRWVMASSFIYNGTDVGVVTAARAPTVAHCTQRVVEPLIRLPKSSVVTWFPLRGSDKLLAVANLHSINFALTLDAYEEQFAGIVDVLAHHDGPMIVAGDLNTWTDARTVALADVARKLGLVEIPFESGRSRFLGREVDHILVRGLSVQSAAAIPVRSSDHNPVQAVLRVTAAPFATALP